jgi:hypothetical protein
MMSTLVSGEIRRNLTIGWHLRIGRIRILSDTVANKIATGELVARPARVASRGQLA